MARPQAAGASFAEMPAPAMERVHLGATLPLSGILVLAAAMRFALLGHNSLWFDEAYVVRVTLSGWTEIPRLLGVAEFHPPLYYLLMKAWIGIAGLSDAAIRIPSAFFGLVSVGLTYALARRCVPLNVSLLSAFLVAVAPFEVMAGQDARMYALLGTLTLASTLVLLRAVEDRRFLPWGAYVVLGAAMLYTQYLGFLVLAAQGVWVVSFERRHLGLWIAAIAAMAVLYAPWMPVLAAQLGRAPSFGPGDAVTWQDLSQLLGLFAFGGSLLGMPSFFFRDTSLHPVEQGLILLPFLVVLWQGIRALAADRRRLVLLGGPLAVVVCIPFAFSLARPAFAARWFSFLLPFYAIVLAQGIVDLACRMRHPRTWTLAVLTSGLLLYSVPVLDRYYVDPAFRPYQWRDAARLVRAQVRPGDFFLYGDYQNQLVFTYYFGVSHPGMALFPHPDFTAVRRLAASHPRLWLIVAPPFTDTMLAKTIPVIQDAFTYVGQSPRDESRVFPFVYLFEAKRQAPGGTRVP